MTTGIRLTQAEATVLGELRWRELGASRPQLAEAYRRLLELAGCNDPIDSILAAHLAREVLSATPGALGIELARERLARGNVQRRRAEVWLPEHRLHVGRDFGMQRGSHVAIGVERQRDRTVAEEFLNDLGRNAAIEQMGGGSVPEVVDPDSWECGLIEGSMKPLRRPGSVNGSSDW